MFADPISRKKWIRLTKTFFRSNPSYLLHLKSNFQAKKKYEFRVSREIKPAAITFIYHSLLTNRSRHVRLAFILSRMTWHKWKSEKMTIRANNIAKMVRSYCFCQHWPHSDSIWKNVAWLNVNWYFIHTFFFLQFEREKLFRKWIVKINWNNAFLCYQKLSELSKL